MLPELTTYAAEPSHVWGGPIGVSRDWQPSVSFNPATGIARAGNYVGDGVTASYLAGKTLADLMTSKTTDLTAQPWVNHNSKNWEAEPGNFGKAFDGATTFALRNLKVPQQK